MPRRTKPQPAKLQAPATQLRRKRTVGQPYPIGITTERAAARLKTAHLRGDAPVGTLSQADFSALMHEVIEDVREATGWRVTMPQHFVRSRAEVAQSLRDELPEDASPQHRRVAANEAIHFAEHTYAYYDPPKRLVVLVANNVRRANYDIVRSILHHELVHAAQHQRYPQFMAAAGYLQDVQSAEDGVQSALAERFAYSMVKLIEGHAHLLEMRSRLRYYPQANRPPRHAWLVHLLRSGTQHHALNRFLRSPYAGALELAAAEHHEPLHTVLKRLYADLQATVETFRTPEERQLLAQQAPASG